MAKIELKLLEDKKLDYLYILKGETQGGVAEDEKSFYEMVGDFLLQMKQRQVIERKLF